MAQAHSVEADSAKLTLHRRGLHALTGIRFFAALYVVLFHSRLSANLMQGGHVAAGNFMANGFLAVPLFFLLSGFILAYTYEGHLKRVGDYRRFFEARFARIWPLYFLSLLLSLIPVPNVPSFWHAAATLLMVQAWNPFDMTMAGGWNFVCWTISCEFLFYLCFPWFQTYFETKGRSFQLTALGLILAVSVWTNSASRGLGYLPAGVWRYIPLAVTHVPEFLAGAALGNIFLHKVRHGAYGTALPMRGVFTYAALLIAVFLLCQGPSHWTSLIVPSFAALIYALAAEALAAERTYVSRLLSSKVLILGGGISYSMYLMQLVEKPWIAAAFNRLGVISTGARLMGNLVFLLVMSYVLFAFFENPVRKVLRGFFARREMRQQDLALTKKARSAKHCTSVD